MRRERGMAVVMALLVVAMAATAAAVVLWQQGLWLRQVEADRANAQANLVADGGIGWAIEVLRYDGETTGTDTLAELWAQPLPRTDAQGVAVSGQLADAQGRFNLNNLVQNGQAVPAQLALYRRLLTELQLPVSLADALADYLDAADEARAGSAESAWYLTQPRPYRSANAPLVRLGQLAWVKGYTPGVIATLAPHVSVLPGSEPVAVNVNTATEPVLRALIEGARGGALQGLISQRVDNPFADVADFKARLPADARVADGVPIGVASKYFLLASRVERAPINRAVSALIVRDSRDTRLMWRSDGELAPPPPVDRGKE